MSYLLQQLLTESALREPDRQAVRFQGMGLTYAQLDSVTNQLARALQAVGVRRGDRVAIYLHKSLASVVAVFGILKAGAMYVPLDPTAPPRRLAYITRDCDIKVAVTSRMKLPELAQVQASGSPLTTAVLADGTEIEPQASGGDLRLITQEELQSYDSSSVRHPGTIETDLAYILYTSGSTGQPKGVMISHRTVLTFINWAHDRFAMSALDRVTSHAPLHFDLSTFDIYVTAKAGGTIILIPENMSVFPSKLAKHLQDEQISVTYLVPSILSLLVNYGDLGQHDLSRLRAVLFAGEVFPIKYLHKLVSAIPKARFYNLYGPTETNVCTYYEVQPEDLRPERTQPVPIGVACENIEVFAVNEHHEIVTQPGEEGELWVRGSCVAQGYWGDPEKTARSFVRNPFQTAFDELAYRTGDIVFLGEDKTNWVYVGRRDHMVKSRGYRIELGEIESVLYGHPSVNEAAVIAIPDELIGSRLVAFVVPLDGSHLELEDILGYAVERLPRYMVPERIEIRSGLPKTSSGKVDRTALAQQGAPPLGRR